MYARTVQERQASVKGGGIHHKAKKWSININVVGAVVLIMIEIGIMNMMSVTVFQDQACAERAQCVDDSDYQHQ